MKKETAPDSAGSRVERLRREVSAWADVPQERVGIVRSPYRVCPLGAHVDHQLGEVTGMALDRALLLAFSPRRDRRIVVRSRQFPRQVEFSLDEVSPEPTGDWADYLRGAVLALRRAYALKHGMTAAVDGHENVGGLSSSAAAGVAYLLALEAANGLSVSPGDNIEFDRIIENRYIGLNNGILDQSSILLGRKGYLMHLDCRSGASQLVPFGGRQEVSVVVLYSGLRLPLAESDYNLRVAECRAAAGLLLKEAGLCPPGRPVLREVPPEVFERYAGRLPETLRRRATHFFGEQQRVHRGVALWRQGELEEFGDLVSESGRSSIENYECGNEYLRTAYNVLRECPGVYGARFSGAGFRGCCIGLAQPEHQPQIAERALRQYLEQHPDMEGKAQVYACRPADGASVLQ